MKLKFTYMLLICIWLAAGNFTWQYFFEDIPNYSEAIHASYYETCALLVTYIISKIAGKK